MNNNLDIFVKDSIVNKILELEKKFVYYIGNGYNCIEYHIPENLKKHFNDGEYMISNIETPSGDYVFSKWTTAYINDMDSIESQMGWIRISYNDYVNYVNTDGKLLLADWLKNTSSLKNYSFNANKGFAQIVYKNKRCKLYPDGTIERWNANIKNEFDNFCTKKDLDLISDEYDDIINNLQLKNGVISFSINYEDFVDAGYPENSRLFLSRDAHSWNDFKSKDYYRSKSVTIRISKPPRCKGAYNLYIKKSAAYDGIDINPLKTMNDVINALNKRIMTSLRKK